MLGTLQAIRLNSFQKSSINQSTNFNIQTLGSKLEFLIQMRSLPNQDQLQMELFSNTKCQGLKELADFPVLNYGIIPNFGNDLQNTLSQRSIKPEKKVGFVPFKMPVFDDIQIPFLVMDEEVSGESEQSLLISSQEISLSGGKSAKNKKGPYRKYTIQQKIRAVQILNSGKDLKSVAKLFNIPRRNLLRWRKNGCQRKEGGGRPTDSSMQDVVCQMLKQGLIETQKQIRQSAKKLSSLKNFKASKGWFVKFCKRYGIDPHNIKPIQKQNL